MRVLAAVLLFSGSLAGCVGPNSLGNFGRFSDDNLAADYALCMSNPWEPYLYKLCDENRQHSLAYRWSYSRFWPDISGGSSVQGPVPVIILN